jgi:hypothetical protein
MKSESILRAVDGETLAILMIITIAGILIGG